MGVVTEIFCDELAEALKSCEWAATTWGDYPTCPFCWRLKGGADFVNPPEKYPPDTHEDDCRWVALMEQYRRWSNDR